MIQIQSLFSEHDLGPVLEKQKQKTWYQEHKHDVFGSRYVKNAQRTGKYDFPKVKAYAGDIPSKYISFSETLKMGNPLACVTFFEADFLFEKLWNNADIYIPNLRRYKCVTEPDFSLKIGMPFAAQMANGYRNRALAYSFQEHGLATIPSMTWSTPPSFDFCFDGYDKGGVVIVSTVGVLKNGISIH